MKATNELRPPSKIKMSRLAVGMRIMDIHRATGLSTTRISEIERNVGREPSTMEKGLLKEAIQAAKVGQAIADG